MGWMWGGGYRDVRMGGGGYGVIRRGWRVRRRVLGWGWRY